MKEWVRTNVHKIKSIREDRIAPKTRAALLPILMMDAVTFSGCGSDDPMIDDAIESIVDGIKELTYQEIEELDKIYKNNKIQIQMILPETMTITNSNGELVSEIFHRTHDIVYRSMGDANDKQRVWYDGEKDSGTLAIQWAKIPGMPSIDYDDPSWVSNSVWLDAIADGLNRLGIVDSDPAIRRTKLEEEEENKKKPEYVLWFMWEHYETILNSMKEKIIEDYDKIFGNGKTIPNVTVVFEDFTKDWIIQKATIMRKSGEITVTVNHTASL